MDDGHLTFSMESFIMAICTLTIWVDDHTLPQGTNGSLDPSTYGSDILLESIVFFHPLEVR